MRIGSFDRSVWIAASSAATVDRSVVVTAESWIVCTRSVNVLVIVVCRNARPAEKRGEIGLGLARGRSARNRHGQLRDDRIQALRFEMKPACAIACESSSGSARSAMVTPDLPASVCSSVRSVCRSVRSCDHVGTGASRRAVTGMNRRGQHGKNRQDRNAGTHDRRRHHAHVRQAAQQAGAGPRKSRPPGFQAPRSQHRSPARPPFAARVHHRLFAPGTCRCFTVC